MRILFIGNSRLGDFVLASGLLAHLLDQYPEARFTISCGRGTAPMLAAMPRVERVIAQVKKPYHGHWRDLWLATVSTRWDLVIDMRNTLVSRLLWAKSVKRWHSPETLMPRVEAVARVLDLPQPTNPKLWIGEAQRLRAADWVKVAGRALALVPGATHVHKQWPPERFGALAAALTGEGGLMAGAPVVILGTAVETEAAEAVRQAVPASRLIDLVGQTDPLEAAAVIARCAVYVGNDGGLTHTAAATGIPTFALFGPNPSQSYGPWGAHGHAVLTRIPQAELAAELRRLKETGAPDRCLMESLPVEDVVAAVGRYGELPLSESNCDGAATTPP